MWSLGVSIFVGGERALALALAFCRLALGWGLKREC